MPVLPPKGEDLEKLRQLGRSSVYVAEIESDDVEENQAARRVAEAVCGTGRYLTGVSANARRRARRRMR